MKNSVLLNIILPLVLGISLLYYYQRKTIKAEEIGIGKETTIYTPWVNDYPIHVTFFSHIDTLLYGWQKRGGRDLTLWLGNSQLHSINQYAPGQQNCIR
ncbi:MAG TPA: hypothetical protein PLA14_11705, partial [Ferruginibacter sp.]|nr:hypothetical protein [Ferruginibacter sp.]